MTPDTVVFIGSFVDKYGLPLAILCGVVWALLSRRFVTGSELNYVEERRKEERESRLAAEATVRALTEAVEKLGGSMEDLTETIVEAVERTIEDDRRARR
jgi:hypothetical protein